MWDDARCCHHRGAHPGTSVLPGDETETSSSMKLHVYKSRQWLGASVTSWHGTLVVGARVGGHPWVLGGRAPTCPRPQACAPLQHWNAIQDNLEAFRTPVGACFMGAEGLHRFIWYSPCRSTQMAPVYRKNEYSECGQGVAGAPPAGLTLPCARSP